MDDDLNGMDVFVASDEVIKTRLAVYRKFVSAVVALALAGNAKRGNQQAITNLMREIMPDIVLVGSRRTQQAFIEMRELSETGDTMGILWSIERLMAAMRADLFQTDTEELAQGDLLRVFIKDIDDVILFPSVLKVGG